MLNFVISFHSFIFFSIKYILLKIKEIMTYNLLVNEIKKLPLDEKEDLKNLLDKYLIEEKRSKIYKKYKKSLLEVKEGKIKFSDNVDTLKKKLK